MFSSDCLAEEEAAADVTALWSAHADDVGSDAHCPTDWDDHGASIDWGGLDAGWDLAPQLHESPQRLDCVDPGWDEIDASREAGVGVDVAIASEMEEPHDVASMERVVEGEQIVHVRDDLQDAAVVQAVQSTTEPATIAAVDFSKCWRRRCQTRAEIDHYELCGKVIAVATRALDKMHAGDYRSAAPLLRDLVIMSNAAARASPQSVPRDSGTLQCVTIFSLNRSVSHMARDAVQFNIYHEKVRSARAMAASSVCLMSEGMRLAMEHTATAKDDVTPVLYLDFYTYDETSLKLRLREGTSTAKASEEPMPGVDGHVHEGATHLAQENLDSRGTADVVKAKVLQLHSQWLMVLRRGDQYLTITGPTYQCLKNLENEKADTMKHALESARCVSMTVDRFLVKIRAACTDDHGSNVKAERCLVGESDAWLGLRVPCKLHKIATSATRCFDLLSGFISLMLGLSLSFQIGITCFRRLPKSTISKCVVF